MKTINFLCKIWVIDEFTTSVFSQKVFNYPLPADRNLKHCISYQLPGYGLKAVSWPISSL
jgi:hypothetical protein